MHYQNILEAIQKEVKPLLGKGKVANYIPHLATVSPKKFGMSIHTIEGETYSIGDDNEPFSIQSISKAFMLSLAMGFVGEKIWKKVGREPSGTAFNSLVQLETENGFPRNPFINAGAHVVTDIVMSHSKNPKKLLLDFVRKESRNKSINFDKAVANSEKENGFRNAALANFLKSYQRIDNKVEDVLNTYFHQCALSMSCNDLAKAAHFMANNGISSDNKTKVLTPKQIKRLNAVMMTCGLYDAGGDFAFRVGLPGKSGVGGGIIAIVPNKMSIAVWSPGLDESGSSLAGVKALELFTSKTKLSVF